MKKILTTIALSCIGALTAMAQTQNCDLQMKITSHVHQQTYNVDCRSVLTVNVEVLNAGPDVLNVDSPLSMAITSPYDSAWYGPSNNIIRLLTTFRPQAIAVNSNAATYSYSARIDSLYILYKMVGNTPEFQDFYYLNPETGLFLAEFKISGVGAPGSSGYWEETGLVVDADSTNDFQYILLNIDCPIGIKEINANTSKLNVYPNPTNSGTASFDFEFIGNETATIRVFDITGRTVLTQEVKGAGLETVKLDVSSLNAGMYNLEIATADRRGVSKFTVAK